MSPMKKREAYTVCFNRNHFFVFTVERPTEEAQCKVDRRGMHTISVGHNVPLEVRSRSVVTEMTNCSIKPREDKPLTAIQS